MDEKQLRAKVFQDPVYFIAFGFGSGLAPKAPGTWGTIAAIPLFLCMSYLPLFWYMLFTLAAFIVGVWMSEKVTRDLGQEDYQGIVWDEVVGYWLCMMAIPVSLSTVIAGCILFRIFDILKPPPIRWVDAKVKGGLGIMLDDVLAAIPAWFILFFATQLRLL